MSYKVRFVDFPEHYHRLKSEIDTAIQGVLEGGDYIMRSQLREFEKNLANFLGVKHAIGVANGTDAILLSMKAAGIGRGDEVITVAHTFAATVTSIVHCNATPVLVDIGQDHNMDVSKVEAAITKKTKAIIPVHLNGRVCDMDRLMRIASEHNIPVIEDAAQALGGSFKGKKAGSFGLTGCFSFYPAKILGALGDGGAVTTSDDATVEKLLLLRDHYMNRDTGEFLGYGFNSRLDNLHAAVLDVKLKHLPQWIERRRELAALYHKGLSSISSIKLPPPPGNGDYFDVYQNYVLRSQQRDELVKHLRSSGVEIIVSWPKPLHKHEALGLTRFNLPMTEQISREVLSIPLYPEMSNDSVKVVVDAIRSFDKR